MLRRLFSRESEAARRLADDIELLHNSPLVDPVWYRETYADLRDTPVDVARHYLEHGAREGRNPGPQFDTRFYLRQNPDVAASGLNPLVHYLLRGQREGRSLQPSGASAPQAKSHLPEIAPTDAYLEWRHLNERGEAIFSLQRRQARMFSYRPLISVVVPVYKVSIELARALIQSVQAQTYSHWELCLALAWFEDKNLAAYLKNEAKKDSRLKLKILPENGGISRNSNVALELAKGDFIGLLDHDDTLSADALFEMVRALNDDPSIDFLYSDKDTMDEGGWNRFNPLFKPAWSPELMLSVNYLTHFNLLRTSRVREIGGWDPATDGAQDWDLFLRFIDKSTKVHAVRRPLYHWRIVETSVASGLGAKPWAADAQLRTVTRYLESNGWAGAVATFAAENIIRVKWNESFEPKTLIFVIGDDPERPGPAWTMVRSLANSSEGRISAVGLRISDQRFAEKAARLVEDSSADILVFIDDQCSPQEGWLTELSGPLQSEAIAVVGGRLENSAAELIEGGWVFPDGKPRVLYRGEKREHWGILAGAWCCRNHLAVSGSLLALRRSAFDAAGGFSKEPAWGRYDLDLSIKISARRIGRIMLNTYACGTSASESVFGKRGNTGQDSSAVFLRLFPSGDPFLHPSLTFAGQGRPVLRLPPAPHRFDFIEEAKYSAAQYDAPESAFTASIAPSHESKPIRRLAWFVPDFSFAFYGGIHTILRAAEYMRVARDIHPIFVVLGAKEPEAIRAVISQAFPDLSVACDVTTIPNVNIPENLIEADAAVATLWVTAYAVIRLKSVRRRFYFVQDYEPLFYPAGTTYGLAEATYRFGFHGICNTYPLREIYESYGGTADYFIPAVDTNIFHQRGRTPRSANEPLLLFSYARPGHPRNCFEVIAEGLVELKRRMRDRLQIITAGAEWNPSDYGLSGIVEHLGLLSYGDTGKLYRSVDAGIVAMATCHPSYLPFELMACGALVATNRNRHTAWLLKDQENCVLFNLTRSSIADTVEAALEDEARIREITAAGLNTIDENHDDWSKACETISNAILRKSSAGISAPPLRKTPAA
jgi:glycosyltransferase involved in cell wall biosynthesis